MERRGESTKVKGERPNTKAKGKILADSGCDMQALESTVLKFSVSELCTKLINIFLYCSLSP